MEGYTKPRAAASRNGIEVYRITKEDSAIPPGARPRDATARWGHNYYSTAHTVPHIAIHPFQHVLSTQNASKRLDNGVRHHVLR